jgi:hypothetical protein
MNYVGESRGEVLPELLVASRMVQDDNTPTNFEEITHTMPFHIYQAC